LFLSVHLTTHSEMSESKETKVLKRKLDDEVEIVEIPILKKAWAPKRPRKETNCESCKLPAWKQCSRCKLYHCPKCTPTCKTCGNVYCPTCVCDMEGCKGGVCLLVSCSQKCIGDPSHHPTSQEPKVLCGPCVESSGFVNPYCTQCQSERCQREEPLMEEKKGDGKSCKYCAAPLAPENSTRRVPSFSTDGVTRETESECQSCPCGLTCKGNETVDHMRMCSLCAGWYCGYSSDIKECDACPLWICEACSDKCGYCYSTYCGDEFVLCRPRCKKCSGVTCPGCKCDSPTKCPGDVCRECTRQCSNVWCPRTLCRCCVYDCPFCQKPFCSECIEISDNQHDSSDSDPKPLNYACLKCLKSFFK